MTKLQKVRSTLLFTLSLSHRSNGKLISAKFYEPFEKVDYVPQVQMRVSHWECRLRIAKGGQAKTLTHSGSNWLGAFLNAVEYLQKQIPAGQEDQWVDSSGAESWVIVPMRVPFSWGIDLYRDIAAYSVNEERKFIARIEKRRLKHEESRKKK